MGYSPDAPHLPRLAGVPVEPVFIAGPHRSGTTLLYALLQETGRFNAMTAYHVLRFRRLLADHLAGETERAKADLADRFQAAGVFDRAIDGVRVTPDTPEEYGFVIADPGPPRLRPANLRRFAALCRKVQLTGDPSRRLLLKNPWDLGRAQFARRHFPRSKFLFLHRDPARTLHSQVNAARTMLAGPNPYLAMLVPRYGLLFRRPLVLHPLRRLVRHGLAARLMAYQLTTGIAAADRDRAGLPPADCHDVRYEDLCARPNEVVAGILGWLGLAAGGVPDLSARIAPRAGPLLPEVERLRPALAARLPDYYRRHGYAAGG
jgi:hypothetical protein